MISNTAKALQDTLLLYKYREKYLECYGMSMFAYVYCSVKVRCVMGGRGCDNSTVQSLEAKLHPQFTHKYMT